jgi:hypothetical protein
MRDSKVRFGVAMAILFVGGAVLGCSTTSPPAGNASTGGSGGTGQGSGGSGGTIGSGSGGSGGRAVDAAEPAGADAATPVTADGGDESDGPAAADGPLASDGPEIVLDGPAAGDDAPAADAVATDDAISSDDAVSSTDGGGPLAACFADPKVIKVCRQLEPACENCPPGGAPPRNATAAACFALVDKAIAGMASDADCAQFAVDHKCTVDNPTTTGNACGSLNCQATGCNATMCETVYGDGDSAACQRLLATCPCK